MRGHEHQPIQLKDTTNTLDILGTAIPLRYITIPEILHKAIYLLHDTCNVSVSNVLISFNDNTLTWARRHNRRSACPLRQSPSRVTLFEVREGRGDSPYPILEHREYCGLPADNSTHI